MILAHYSLLTVATTELFRIIVILAAIASILVVDIVS